MIFPSDLALNLVLTILLISLLSSPPVVSAEKSSTGILTGKILDADGQPVQSAEVFVYDSTDIRRPADYISQKTGQDGVYSVVVSQGIYWAVARVRQGDQKYGPLLPGDRHSGEPLEVDISGKDPIEEDFIVVNLKESGKLTRKTREGFFKIQGRLFDPQSNPLQFGYVFASLTRSLREIPDYISPWTDSDGAFTIYLPQGKYYIGIAEKFPPGNAPILVEINVDRPMQDVNLRLASEAPEKNMP